MKKLLVAVIEKYVLLPLAILVVMIAFTFEDFDDKETP